MNPVTNAPNDTTVENYVWLYPKIQVRAGGYRQVDYGPRIEPIMRLETDDERRIRVRSYISQPTDHSTLPGSPDFMSRVVAFDLPIGFCGATWDRAFMAELRGRADWTQGYDRYFNKGELSVPPIPAIISQETIDEVRKAEFEKYKIEMDAAKKPYALKY